MLTTLNGLLNLPAAQCLLFKMEILISRGCLKVLVRFLLVLLLWCLAVPVAISVPNVSFSNSAVSSLGALVLLFLPSLIGPGTPCFLKNVY